LLAIARAIDPFLPVLILTARDAMEHRLTGLNSGADDYMTKPFDLRELAARLHALVRRTQGRTNQIITAGPLRLEPATGLAWFENEAVTLSRREVDLLTHLATADGRWVPPKYLTSGFTEVAKKSTAMHSMYIFIISVVSSDQKQSRRLADWVIVWGGN